MAAAIIFMGTWRPGTTYQVGNLVGYQNSTYIALGISTNSPPTPYSTVWLAVALAGPQGTTGVQGIQGVAGPTEITDTTSTTFGGVLKGAGGTVVVAVPGTDYVLPSGNITGSAATITGVINESQVTSLATDLAARVLTATTVNGHALSANVTLSASDITTGTLPHAQLPALLSGDVPNNAANTTGNAASITGTILSTQVTGLGTAATQNTSAFDAAGVSATETTRAETAEALLAPKTTTVNGHALSTNVVVSASDLTTGTLPHAQLPALVSGDLPVATSAALGAVQPDGTTISVASGMISVIPFSTASKTFIAPNGGTSYTLPGVPVNPTASFYFVNGAKRIYGVYYDIVGSTLNILSSNPPQTGDSHEIYYS